MTRIEIDHLEIRLRNVSPDTVNSIVGGLGEQILNVIDRSLPDAEILSGMEGRRMIERLDAGVVRGGSTPDTGDLQRAVADSIVRTISGSIPGSRTGSVPGTRGPIALSSNPNGIPNGIPNGLPNRVQNRMQNRIPNGSVSGQ